MEKVLDTRVVSIGNQDFEKLVSRNSFYVERQILIWKEHC